MRVGVVPTRTTAPPTAPTRTVPTPRLRQSRRRRRSRHRPRHRRCDAKREPLTGKVFLLLFVHKKKILPVALAARILTDPSGVLHKHSSPKIFLYTAAAPIAHSLAVCYLKKIPLQLTASRALPPRNAPVSGGAMGDAIPCACELGEPEFRLCQGCLSG